jgi:hypothetical protein
VTETVQTFIVDCPSCNAKVAAIEKGRAEESGWIEEAGEPWAHRLLLGVCPRCSSVLAAESHQIEFEGIDSDHNRWGDAIRVFPNPPKVFSSYRIPKVVKDSLLEADRSLQAGANIAACAMLGRALEALCRDVLDTAVTESSTTATSKPKRHVMLEEGITQLRDQKVIDDRLYDWSQQLRAFRNFAAHPEDITISREDAADLQTFVYAIVEYVYDLADRYKEFERRMRARSQRKKS